MSTIIDTKGKLITIVVASIAAVDTACIADSSIVVVESIGVACIAILAIAVLIFLTYIAIYPLEFLNQSMQSSDRTVQH
jgi:hypothetical protein